MVWVGRSDAIEPPSASSMRALSWRDFSSAGKRTPTPGARLPAARAGVIQGRVAVVNPEKVGLGLTVYVRVKTREHSADWARRLNEVIAAMPEILECHRIGGDVDYLLKVVVADMAGYDRTYKELIGRLPSLADVSALFSMERLKSATALPIPAES